MHAMTLSFSVIVTSQIQAWRVNLIFFSHLISKGHLNQNQKIKNVYLARKMLHKQEHTLKFYEKYDAVLFKFEMNFNGAP